MLIDSGNTSSVLQANKFSEKVSIVALNDFDTFKIDLKY